MFSLEIRILKEEKFYEQIFSYCTVVAIRSFADKLKESKTKKRILHTIKDKAQRF